MSIVHKSPFAFRVELSSQSRRAVTLFGALLFLIVLVRTAWVCDDAYIAFRTADNFVHGYGLRWNVANRVQTFTNPLWLLVIAGASAVTGDVYYTSIALSILLSLGVIALVGLRVAPTTTAATLAFSALTLSKSFVEYSTSGLENALTHLLLAGYLVVWITPPAADRADAPRTRVGTLSLLAALLMTNRVDLGLLVLPPLASAVRTAGIRRVWRAAAIGLLPIVAWELFTIVYYGFAVPNTAYAKLATGIPRGAYLYQGVLYLFDSLSGDPLTMMVIVGAIVAPVITGGDRVLPAAIGLYLAYIVWIGGDFMSGRFLAAPFLCAVCYLVRIVPREPGLPWAGAFALVWLAGFLPGWPTNFSNAQYGRDLKPADSIRENHVNDERRYYYPATGLLTAYRGVMMPNHRWLYLGFQARRNHERVHLTDAAGFVGYAAGPDVYVLDRWALGDPLLARLPADAPWEIGHYPRRIPAGYVETLATGRNVIRDPAVAAFYDRLRVITEDPIWSTQRWKAIVGMNLGRYDHLVTDYGTVRLALGDVSAPKPAGTPWDEAGNVVLTPRGADIDLGRVAVGGRVEISVSGNDTYDVEFFADARRVGRSRIVQPVTPEGSLQTQLVTAPARAYNRIVVRPSGGDGHYSIGHVRLIGS